MEIVIAGSAKPTYQPMYVVFEKDFFEFFSRKVVKTKRVKAKTEIWHGRKNIFQGIPILGLIPY